MILKRGSSKTSMAAFKLKTFSRVLAVGSLGSFDPLGRQI